MPSQTKVLSVISSLHPSKLAVALMLVSLRLQVAAEEPDITFAFQPGRKGTGWGMAPTASVPFYRKVHELSQKPLQHIKFHWVTWPPLPESEAGKPGTRTGFPG